MRRYNLFIMILTGLFCFHALSEGQTAETGTGESLKKLFTRLLVASQDADRLRINDSIENIINNYVRSDDVIDQNLPDLKYLGQIKSPDSRLKIVTWNLLLTDTASRYFCYFIHKSGGENKIYKLTSGYKKDPVRSDMTYTGKNWYGALYYDMLPLKKENRDCWMLLGIDYGNPSITRKIIDVITFTPDGDILFGKKWFAAGKEIKFREVLEYSSSAVITLRFRSDKSIVFDHLVPISAAMKDNREFYAPDFSYDSYNFEKGIWKLVSDVDIRNRKK